MDDYRANEELILEWIDRTERKLSSLEEAIVKNYPLDDCYALKGACVEGIMTCRAMIGIAPYWGSHYEV